MQTDPAFSTITGVDPKTANLRNQLIVWCKHLALEASKAREMGRSSVLLDTFFLEALSSATLTTPVQPVALAKLIYKAAYVKQLADFLTNNEGVDYQEAYEGQIRDAVQQLVVDDSAVDELLPQGEACSNETRLASMGADAYGLHETLMAALIGVACNARLSVQYSREALSARDKIAVGLKQRIRDDVKKQPQEKRKQIKEEWTKELNAYVEHTTQWRAEERKLLDGLVDALVFLATVVDVDALCDYALTLGELNVLALETLRWGVEAIYDQTTPTSVLASDLKKRKCVLFCGDDFEALQSLLKSAEYHDADVWTCGDALAAHAFASFRKKSAYLVGHFSGSWRNQRQEFARFPGAIVMANAPVEEPDGSYEDYIFSTEPTQWSVVRVVPRKANGEYDWTAVFHAANDSPGFMRTVQPSQRVPVGFGGDLELEMLVGKMVDAYRDNALKEVAVIGGQDYPESACDYFERLFDALTPDTKAMTFGDAQFRFLRKPCDDTSLGLPKIFNVGREYDAFATFIFAKGIIEALARKAETAPIAFFVSLWGERSLAVALAFCSQGYRRVFVGPVRPSLWTDTIVAALETRVGLRVTSEPNADLDAPAL
ncbi:MAG: hypothetical protein Q4G03_08880 [Planctomycetia bacterium]|nr:hypothetical protein [Planctomycetia bacterium]